MIGNIYRIYCNPLHKDWEEYHLMPMVEFQTVIYRDEDTAYKCLVLETGTLYEIYRDVLLNEGYEVG